MTLRHGGGLFITKLFRWIARSWVTFLTPNFLQAVSDILGSRLKLFWVSDPLSRSQDHPPKSGKFFCLKSMGRKRDKFSWKSLTFGRHSWIYGGRWKLLKGVNFYSMTKGVIWENNWVDFVHPTPKYEFFSSSQKNRPKWRHFIAKYDLTKHFQIAVKKFLGRIRSRERS